MKTCFACKKKYKFSFFHKNKKRNDGLYVYCKNCKKSHDEFYRNKNKEKISAYHKKYSLKNRERLAIYAKQWREKNKEVIAKKRKQKIKTNIKYRLCHYLRARTRLALKYKNWKKGSKFSEYIGCDSETIRKHLESKFKEGMSWDNYGKWHIDHIIPLSKARSEEELYALSHYKNLQPLWSNENLKKGSKLDSSLQW